MRPADHWDRHARQWQAIGPPLRPCAADIDILVDRLDSIAFGARGAPAQALLLGVTPEIAGLRWPASAELLAVDRSPAMVGDVWPGAGAIRAAAVVGDWKALPLADGSRDLAVADGSFVTLDYPDACSRVFGGVQRVLRTGGLFAVRWFVKPESAESAGTVFDDLFAGRIGNFHVFKWRLAMALQGRVSEGVRLGEVWSAWRDAVPDPAALAARLGWVPASVATIDAYRDAPARYTFPTVAEARAVFAPFFIETDLRLPAYELGERCPHFALRPRPCGQGQLGSEGGVHAG